MPLLATLILVAALGAYFLPIQLLRRKASGQAQDYFIAAERTPPGVIQNSSIAYALKMATFGPFFAWGASGDFWPAIIASASLGLGLYLLNVLRRPMLEFFQSAVAHGQSFTVNEFVARRHGNDSRVRLLAASLTVFALSGLTICEAFGVATVLKPVMPETPYYLVMLGMLALTAIYALPAGISGVLRSTQAQLGMLYLSLFGSTALLLYIVMATLRPLSPHGAFAVLFVAVCCIVILAYRRSRYVDTSPIDTTDGSAPPDGASRREPRGARAFRRFNKILNVCVSIAAVFVVVFTVVELSSRGFDSIVSDGAATLRTGVGISSAGVIALILLPLLYPIVDITNWQRFAALAKDGDTNPAASEGRAVALGRIIRTYATETALVSLFLCMFGAIAVAALRVPAGAHVMQTFVGKIASQQNWVAGSALSLLLVSVVMIALTTMASMLAASLCVLRYDVLSAFRSTPASQETRAESDTVGARPAILIGSGLCLLMLAAFVIFDAQFTIDFSGGGFIALVVAFCCAQLSLAPLVLGPLFGSNAEGVGGVSPGWALAILCISAAAGLAVVAIYFATGNEPWLWAAIPACIGSGWLLFAIARLRPPKAASK
jgi:hypothetical protein